eukprot:Colp12_sorted_trinity150504_noHs@18233
MGDFAAKRFKTDDGSAVKPGDDPIQPYNGQSGQGHYGQKRSREDYEELPPSKVIHVRGLSDQTNEDDLVNALSIFGRVSYVMMMHKVRQALIEMQDIEAATGISEYNKARPLYLGGRSVHFSFSKSQEIKRPGMHSHQPSGQATTAHPQTGSVILLTIHNAIHPINTEVVHTICSNYGKVLRIVIFRKTNVQSMVEFDSPVAAGRAREALDGQDIYAGCCTIKAEISTVETLTVRKNDDLTYDYTTSDRPAGGFTTRAPPSGQRPSLTSYNDPYAPPSYNPPAEASWGSSSSAGQQAQSAVLMVYGLKPHINCERLFNLFCLYANVMKVKFLGTKEGAAMVELGSPQEAALCLENLNRAPFFGEPLTLTFSKHQHIVAGPAPPTLSDGSAGLQDFSSSRNNRYTRSRPDQKKLFPPTKVLHFFSAPPNTTNADLVNHFASLGFHPSSIKLFEKNAEEGKSKSGLLIFETMEQAVECVVMANNTQLDPNVPHHIKLTFSNSTAA